MSLLDNLKNTVNPTTVDDMKSAIGKRGGISVPNRFSITFTPPSQTLLNLDLQSVAASALSGTFSVGGLVNDPRDISIFCESCSLPGRLIETEDYDAADRSLKAQPTRVTDEDVTATFLLTNDYYMKKIFDRWQGAVIDVDSHLISYPSEYKRDVIIQQLDQNNTPVYGVKLINAFPTTVNSIDLSNDSSDTKHSVSVTFSYDNFEVEGAIKSIINSVSEKLNVFRRLI
jgi:hypothetical protein